MKKFFICMLLLPALLVMAQEKIGLIPEDGLKITTQSVQPDGKVIVDVEFKLAAQADGKKKAKLSITQEDRIIKTTSKSIKPGTSVKVALTLKDVKLWSPEFPNLYQLSYTICEGKQELENKKINIGFRTVAYTAEQGINLNGDFRKLHGIVWPDELHWLKNCNKACKQKLLSLMQDMGADALLVDANHPNDDLVSLCDEMGVMVLVDLSNTSEGGLNSAIYHLRNHPSVMIWSADNQSLSGNDAVETEKILKRVQTIKQTDGTRLVTAGLKQVELPMEKGLINAIDIPSLDDCPLRYQETHNKTPQHQLIGLNVPFGAENERKLFNYEKWVVGLFLKTDMIPFISKTDTFYLYRSMWHKNAHTLHIATQWNRTDGEHVIVPVYSDRKQVELLLNGKSLGKEPSKVWQVPYEAGELTAIAYNNKGKETQRVLLRTAEEAMRIELLPEYAGNMTFVTLRVTDHANNVCGRFNQDIHIKAEGTGKICGVITGDKMLTYSNNDISMRPEEGVCTVVIEGNAILTVTSAGMIGGSLQINHNH